MILALHDHTDCKDYVTEAKEEIIVQKRGSDEILFYCTFYERVKTEIVDAFPAKVKNKKEFMDAVGEFLIYYYQGIKFI